MESSKSANNLKQLCKLIDELPEEHNLYLRELFHGVPLWLFEEMRFISVGEDHPFIREGEPVNQVFILVSGNVRAMDYRIMNIEYNYMNFTPVIMFGTMELLNNMERYQTTLIADKSCRMISLPAHVVMKWMRSDANALLLEAKSIISYLLEQARSDRVFLFAQGMERIILLMVKEYERNIENGYCTINFSRKEWSNRTGLSTKTVDRALQTITEKHLVEKRRKGIRFDLDQYQRMRNYLSEKIGEF